MLAISPSFPAGSSWRIGSRGRRTGLEIGEPIGRCACFDRSRLLAPAGKHDVTRASNDFEGVIEPSPDIPNTTPPASYSVQQLARTGMTVFEGIVYWAGLVPPPLPWFRVHIILSSPPKASVGERNGSEPRVRRLSMSLNKRYFRHSIGTHLASHTSM